MTSNILLIRKCGMLDYQTCWQEMKNFTDTRHSETQDELWVTQHPPVFTQGQNGKAENILQSSNIPIVATDRGGQVTYHGPGQLLFYTLIDVKRKNFNVRQFVTHLENTIIDTLASYDVTGNTQCKAPGVYVNAKKICSIGLRIRKGFSYHGLAFNVDMDLTPFSYINPCGFANLQMTQLKNEINDELDYPILIDKFIDSLKNNLGYTSVQER